MVTSGSSYHISGASYHISGASYHIDGKVYYIACVQSVLTLWD